MDERGVEDGRSPRGQEVKIAKRKPWGCEFLAYENDNVAIWHLLIDPWAETSLHCHPNKKTGLIVLEGGGESMLPVWRGEAICWGEGYD